MMNISNIGVSGPSSPGIKIKPAPLPATYSAKKSLSGSPPAGKRERGVGADPLAKRSLWVSFGADDIHPTASKFQKIGMLPRTPRSVATLEAVQEDNEVDGL